MNRFQPARWSADVRILAAIFIALSSVLSSKTWPPRSGFFGGHIRFCGVAFMFVFALSFEAEQKFHELIHLSTISRFFL